MFNTPIKKKGGYTNRLLQTAGIGDTSQRSTVRLNSTQNKIYEDRIRGSNVSGCVFSAVLITWSLTVMKCALEGERPCLTSFRASLHLENLSAFTGILAACILESSIFLFQNHLLTQTQKSCDNSDRKNGQTRSDTSSLDLGEHPSAPFVPQPEVKVLLLHCQTLKEGIVFSFDTGRIQRKHTKTMTISPAARPTHLLPKTHPATLHHQTHHEAHFLPNIPSNSSSTLKTDCFVRGRIHALTGTLSCGLPGLLVFVI